MSPEPDPLQDALFPVETPPVKVPARKPTDGRPRWSKYRPKHPQKCDDCMLVLLLAKGNAPASRRAKFRRQQGGSDLLLCYGHAQARREEDGLPGLPGVGT